MRWKGNLNDSFKHIMKNIIILTGPTAVGKTELSIQLAKKVGAEIISADSMQVYKGMDIGTAKISKEEMCGVKHYLIDILSPSQAFDVVQFQTLAKKAIKQIYQNGHIPMIVGGTGFYIQSVLYDIDFSKDTSHIADFNKTVLNDIIISKNNNKNNVDNENSNYNIDSEFENKEIIEEEYHKSIYAIAKDDNIDDKFENKATINEEYRKFLYHIAQIQGNTVLHRMLEEVDKESAENIHPNNVKRVIRALEYFRETGSKISSHNKIQRQKESPYNFVYFVLNDDRKKLYEKIDARVERMFQKGLIDEIKKLIDCGLKKESTAMNGIGYKELFDYYEGKASLEQTIELIKQHTRHFAKRQLTWFKRERDVLWINYPDYDNSKEKILKAMLEKLQERNIINKNGYYK